MRLPSRWVTNPAGSNPNRKERTLREFALFVFPPYPKRSPHSRLPPPTALHGAARSQKGRPPRCPRPRYGLPYPIAAHTTQKQNFPIAASTAKDRHRTRRHLSQNMGHTRGQSQLERDRQHQRKNPYAPSPKRSGNRWRRRGDGVLRHGAEEGLWHAPPPNGGAKTAKIATFHPVGTSI